ncbi:MAG TPA: hypothetical protein VMX35_10430 [Acidobacteriota bacterium]|nr:hypothetical protein [Acidobacteriota bacterium]
MRFKSLAALGIASFLCLALAAQENSPDRDAYVKMSSDIRKAETIENKLAIARDFIIRFPDSQYTGNAIGNAVYILSRADNPVEKSLEFIGSVESKLSDTKILMQVKREKAKLYGSGGRVGDLKNIAKEMSASGSMDYIDILTLGRAAVQCEAWDLALESFDGSLKFATREAIVPPGEKADPYWTEANILKSIRLRRSISLSGKGWALVKLGRVEEGLVCFSAAEKERHVTYLGIPKGMLNIYWARTLLEMKDYDGAIEKLGLGAVFKGDKESLDLMLQAYEGKTSGKEGFDDFLWRMRLDLAKPIDDVAFRNYEGNEFRLSSLRGKVVLLNFWYPT